MVHERANVTRHWFSIDRRAREAVEATHNCESEEKVIQVKPVLVLSVSGPDSKEGFGAHAFTNNQFSQFSKWLLCDTLLNSFLYLNA